MYTMVIIHRRHEMHPSHVHVMFLSVQITIILQHNSIVLNTMPEESFLRDENTIMYVAFNQPFFVFLTQRLIFMSIGQKASTKTVRKACFELY